MTDSHAATLHYFRDVVISHFSGFPSTEDPPDLLAAFLKLLLNFLDDTGVLRELGMTVLLVR